MKRILVVLATVLTTILAVVGVAAVPAQASHIGSCIDGNTCVYSTSSNSPRLTISYSGSGGLWTCNNLNDYGWNDVNVWEYNGFGSGLRIQFYLDHNCTNESFILCNGCVRTHPFINIFYKKLSSWRIIPA